MRRRHLTFVLSLTLGCGLAVAAQIPPPGPSQTYRGLQMTASSIERAPTASLNDCPPGENRVNATARPGEEFAIVTVAFKVLPTFQPGPIKRPVLVDAQGKTYNTAVSFMDVGKVPEFSCQMPFRVPAGTALGTLMIDTAKLDLANVAKKSPTH
jgi:hypothetical protein